MQYGPLWVTSHINSKQTLNIFISHPKISQYTFSSNKPSLQTHAQHYACSCIKKIAGFIEPGKLCEFKNSLPCVLWSTWHPEIMDFVANFRTCSSCRGSDLMDVCHVQTLSCVLRTCHCFCMVILTHVSEGNNVVKGNNELEFPH